MSALAPSVRKANVTQRKSAAFVPTTLDKESRTVEATIASKYPVNRGGYTEALVIQPGSYSLHGKDGGPLLDSHGAGRDGRSIKGVYGRFYNVRILADGTLGATLWFSNSPEGEAAMQQVADGTIRDVSIGYRIIRDREQKDARGGLLVTVEEWLLLEVSLVSVPADPTANIRSMEINMDDDEIETIEQEPEQRRNTTPARSREQTFRRQIAQLRQHALGAGITESDADELLDGVQTMTAARQLIFEELAARSRQTMTYSSRVSGDNQRRGTSEDVEENIIGALAERLSGGLIKADRNPLAGQRTANLARHFAEARHVSVRNMGDSEVLGLAYRAADNWVSGGAGHTISDFPALLAEAGDRALMARFGANLTPLQNLSILRNAKDYRPKTFIRPGEAPKLQPVGEGGEVKRGTLSEEKQGFSVKNSAHIFSITRQALINDDLGAFTDMLQAFAQATSTTVGDEFYNLIADNEFGGIKLSDGKNLFHNDHFNISTGAPLSVESLGEARQAMRLQKNVNGTGRAGAIPAVLLVGPALETQAEKVVSEIAAAHVQDVNPFSGKLRVQVEDRYEGNGWWLFADPAQRPTFVHGYLDGREGPQLETRDGWDVLGTEFRCVLDFGCGVYDWRAAHFNPGE